jgi:Adenylosuccinate synthetase
MRAKTEVVAGAQWGDEGKGKIVDVLSESFGADSPHSLAATRRVRGGRARSPFCRVSWSVRVGFLNFALAHAIWQN